MSAKVKAVKAKAVPICSEKHLPDDQLIEAAETARQIFPANAPSVAMGSPPDVKRIAVLTSKFWGDRAKDLTVGFMSRPSQAMIDKVLKFANSWGEFSKVKFNYTSNVSNAAIRISFGAGGYWSYLGTDNLQIAKNRQTMNLEGFTVNTRESEWTRIVQHEFGHALGCPHEQQRQAILDLLDERKTIEYFKRTQGWSEAEVRQQILIPLEERSLMPGSSAQADVMSIMCYQFPGSITKSGQAIPGGADYSGVDRQYFGKIYPRDDVTEPTPPAVGVKYVIAYDSDMKELGKMSF